MTTTPNLYDQDFYTWTQRQAELLRQGQITEIDAENLAEEIESMGKSDRRALGSHLQNVLLHLLKWRYQARLRTPSWRQSIRNARREIDAILQDSPSLRRHLEDLVVKKYAQAREDAFDQTGLKEQDFPDVCPWTLEQILSDAFWPD